MSFNEFLECVKMRHGREAATTRDEKISLPAARYGQGLFWPTY